jgi:hypothetical protein
VHRLDSSRPDNPHYCDCDSTIVELTPDGSSCDDNGQSVSVTRIPSAIGEQTWCFGYTGQPAFISSVIGGETYSSRAVQQDDNNDESVTRSRQDLFERISDIRVRRWRRELLGRETKESFWRGNGVLQQDIFKCHE